MANTDLLLEVGEPGSATTLDAGYTAGGASITVVATTNWPAVGKAVIFAIDEAEVVNGEEIQVEGTYNEYVGIVATATSVTDVDWMTGVGDRNYSAGALTRVYIPVSAERENRIVEWGLTHANPDGTLKDVIGANGNERLKWVDVASAVNEITITNAATGNRPTITATGSDSNVSLGLSTIGSGQVNINALELASGWLTIGDTWTYASATTITVPTDATTRYSVGDKIRLVNTTTKYFYIVGVAATTLTITGGSDYTLANAAISGIRLSKSATPLDFPRFMNYTPTLTGFSADPTNTVNRFVMDGKKVTAFIRQASTGTSNATTFTITLPITAATITNARWSGHATVTDNSVTQATPGYMRVISGGAGISVFKDSAETVWTGSGGKALSVGQVTYEAA